MAQRGAARFVVLAVMVLGFLIAWPSPGRAAAFAERYRAEPLAGVQVRGLRGGGLSVDVGRVGKGAPVRIEAVAAGAVAGGVETTSAVCRRVGGILCINGDFADPGARTTALGGIIHDGAIQRSPISNHPQLWLGSSGPGAGPLGWSARLEATVTYQAPSPGLGVLLPPQPPKVETVSLPLNAVNRSRGADQVVLYTPAWASNTRTRGGGDEAVLGGGAPSVNTNTPVTTREWKGNPGSVAIPGDGMVVSAEGAGMSRMRAFWAKAADPKASRRSVVLRVTADRVVEESVGGHPVILANGKTLIGGSRDPFATNRHPRTLVGWNPAGDLILATVDGRQPGHSQGVSLVEAADVLRQVGATSGFNLDGGGSSTFVSLSGRTPKVLNRPSDGNERRVTTVLAVVPVNAAAVRSVVTAAPPQPAPAPSGPPPADEASTDGLGTRSAPDAAATTSPAPPTTVAPVLALPPAEMVPGEAPPAVALELAAPIAELAAAPATPTRTSTGGPGAVAALALTASAAATVRTARRARRS